MKTLTAIIIVLAAISICMLIPKPHDTSRLNLNSIQTDKAETYRYNAPVACQWFVEQTYRLNDPLVIAAQFK